jgi:hypothetical protein
VSYVRKEPYTEIGIKRMACFRCGSKPSYATWSICADGNRARPVCWECDCALNEMVLRWAGFGEPEILNLMANYRDKGVCHEI